MEPLARNVELLGTTMHNRVLGEYGHLLRSSIEGQAIELGWRRDHIYELDSRDYLEMVSLKTCAYTTIYPLRVGALIGSWGRADLAGVTRFGLLLGAAFQITDDVLNLTSTESVYGKEINGDLAEGKRTLMLIHLIGAADAVDRANVISFLDGEREGRTEATISEVRDLMDRYGSIEYAAGLMDGAEKAFDETFGTLPDSPDKEFLSELIDFVVNRTF